MSSTDEPGSKVKQPNDPRAWWLMKRGTVEYDFTLPDWWGLGEVVSPEDIYGNKPSNDYAWSFGFHPSLSIKFISDGKIQVGDKLQFVLPTPTPLRYGGGDTLAGNYLGGDDWYIYAIGAENRIFIAKISNIIFFDYIFYFPF